MTRLLNRFTQSLRACGVFHKDAGEVAIALSGGPDSLALAALASQWHYRAQEATEPPLALVVDHALRPGSADEAHHAAVQASDALGLRARVLTVDWAGSPPAARHKLRAARDARYALLLEACRHEGARSLLVAHHAEDQAETMLLRLLHASGIDGLACMPLANDEHLASHGVRLLRPLLRVHKHELVRHCRRLGLDPADDPTNDDVAFQRNLLRQLMQQDEEEWQQQRVRRQQPQQQRQQEREQERQCSVVAAAGEGVGSGGGSGGGGGSSGGGKSGRVPRIVLDALLLQQVCASASRAQQQQATELLRRAVLRASPGVNVPRKHAQHGGARSGAHYRVDLASQALGPLQHAILRACHFAQTSGIVASVALSRLLQAVAGKSYPPSLSDCTKLARRLAGGTLVGAFTGGACVAQPLVRSKGRYVLVVPQKCQNEAQRLLRGSSKPAPEQHPCAADRADEAMREAAEAALG